jgi:Aspartyl/Asparaginyl beta-hydroxylase
MNLWKGDTWVPTGWSFLADGFRSFNPYLSTVVWGLVVLVLLSAWFGSHFLCKYSNRHTAKQNLSAVSACKNPNCVRCQRYRQVQQNAQTRLAWILQDLKTRDPVVAASMHSRIPFAVRRGHVPKEKSWQNPSVLMVDDLATQEIVTDRHRETCQYLQKRATREFVQRALQSIPATMSWTVNDSPRGRWEVLHLLNQGSWNQSLLEVEHCGNAAWQDLLNLIRNTPGLMDQCLFGNVMISRIYPGTIIEPHCGPTNVRHRLQLALEIPSDGTQKLSLLVGRAEQIAWNCLDHVFVFDDSFVHSVDYPRIDNGIQVGTDSTVIPDRTRTVLIIDLWHPDLSSMERSLLQKLYPPFSSRDDKSKF